MTGGGTAGKLASCGHPANDDGECGCAWWPERAPVYAAADETVCECWVCDRQCGGTTGGHSCGPLKIRDGHPVCEWCRSAADVWDVDRQGARVKAKHDRVRLEANVRATFQAQTLRLTPGAARYLATQLLSAADDAERAL